MVALRSSSLGHSPAVSLCHITSYLSTVILLGMLHDRERVVCVVESILVVGVTKGIHSHHNYIVFPLIMHLQLYSFHGLHFDSIIIGGK